MKIIEAIETNDLEKANLAITEEGVKIKDSYGRTPLYLAAEAGALDIVKLLIKADSDVDAVDSLGNTPLMRAIIKGFPKVAEELLKSKANPNIADEDGYTAIHFTAYQNNLTLMKKIAAHEGAIDALTKNGSTVMHCAAVGVTKYEENWELIDWLLKGGIAHDTINSSGVTPLDNFNEADIYYGEIFQEHISEIIGITEAPEV